MALLQRVLIGDVVDADVSVAVAVDVAEVDGHALVRIVAEHLRRGEREAASALEQREAQMASSRAVVQESVRPEVAREIQLRQEVAVEVGRADAERPPPSDDVVEHAPRIRKALRGPSQQMRSSSILGTRHRMLHVVGHVGPCVENAGAVGEIVADNEITVAIAVEISERRGVRVPPFDCVDELSRDEPRSRHLLRVRESEKQDRRATPVVDEEVNRSIFVEVARQAAHRRRGRRIVRQRKRVERERRVTRAGAGRGRDDHLIGAHVDVAEIVRQAVGVEVVQGDGGADGGDPRGDVTKAWIHFAHGPHPHARDLW